MYQDEDYLLKQIRHLIALIVSMIRDTLDLPALDERLQGAFGLSLRTIDALSAESLAGLVPPDDPQGQARLRGLAEVLDALAEREPEAALSESRRAKAARIRGLLDRSA